MKIRGRHGNQITNYIFPLIFISTFKILQNITDFFIPIDGKVKTPSSTSSNLNSPHTTPFKCNSHNHNNCKKKI
jgi:hypothetical protein